MKILIVKTSSLGDIVQAFPVLHHLKESCPEATIDWVVERPFASLVRAHPFVNRVIEIDTKRWRYAFFKYHQQSELYQFLQQIRSVSYDLLFDLQANLKSGLVTALARAKKKIGFGRKSVHEWPNLLFTRYRFNPPAKKNIYEDYLFLAQSITQNFAFASKPICLQLKQTEKLQFIKICEETVTKKGRYLVMVCPGSNWPNKQLRPTILFSFLKLIHHQFGCHFLFVWGTEEEKKIASKLFTQFPQCSKLIEKMSLPLLQNLMAKMNLIIAMDSLPLHLAATTSTPTYSVFGPSLASKFKPIGEMHEAFQGKCPYGKVFAKRCPILRTCATGSCINSIEAQQLSLHFAKFAATLHWKKI